MMWGTWPACQGAVGTRASSGPTTLGGRSVASAAPTTWWSGRGKRGQYDRGARAGQARPLRQSVGGEPAPRVDYRGFVVGFFFAVAFLALAVRFFAALFFVGFLVDFFV